MSRDAEGRTLRYRLYHGETSFEFVGRAKLWFAVSAVFILIGIVSLFTQGLNYGIDFKGGTSWEVIAPGVSVAEARSSLQSVGLGSAKIQIQGADIVRVQADSGTPEEQAAVTNKLAELGKVDPGQVSLNDVGPSWGKDVTKKARTALIVFFILITAYISIQFEWKMAVAALAAVVHDILITVGVYSLSRFEVTPGTVVAFLTILGYSLYDTIVVFDKVRENARGVAASGRMTYSDTVNLSMNQVLMRSLNTSFVAILPILSILVIGAGVMGATVLKDFGLALLVGLLTGAYSSIFIASPLLAILKEREPRYVNVRQRLAAKGGGSTTLTPAAAAALAGAGTGGSSGGKAKATAKATGTQAVKGAGAKGGNGKGAGAKGASAASKGGDVLVPSQTTGSPAKAPVANKPRPANRPGAPRPRKKGKRR
ncbi:MAG: preprotein translocase subunit SecF [Actinomycetota bacterium]|jgi:preprotein translocase subunit SecF|nr:preprotein translocase subunit SecF [Actinomycetota bacterium]